MNFKFKRRHHTSKAKGTANKIDHWLLYSFFSLILHFLVVKKMVKGFYIQKRSHRLSRQLFLSWACPLLNTISFRFSINVCDRPPFFWKFSSSKKAEKRSTLSLKMSNLKKNDLHRAALLQKLDSGLILVIGSV